MAYNEGLDDVNERAVRALFPAILYIGILMILGIIGNPLVIYFYGWTLKPTPSYMFITTLAIFDLITCTISMPLEIVDLVKFYTFESTEACKVLRFVNYFASIASGCTLIIIAVDRYRKICKPFQSQITIRLANWIIVGIVVLSLTFAWPSAIINDVIEVNVTSPRNFIGFDCTTVRDEEYEMYVTFYNIFLFFLFFGAITVLFVLYCLIGKQLRDLRSFRFYATRTKFKKVKLRAKKQVRPMKESERYSDASASNTDSLTSPESVPRSISEYMGPSVQLFNIPEVTFNRILPVNTESSSNSFNMSDQDALQMEHQHSSEAVIIRVRCNSANNDDIEDFQSHESRRHDNENNNAALKSKLDALFSSTSSKTNNQCPESETRDARGSANIDQRKLHAQNINTRRYTVIMLSITMAFILSFLPYLGLSTWINLVDEYEGNLFSDAELAGFQIGMCSFLLSSACNPLIYGFLNTEFQKFVKSCCCRKRHKKRKKRSKIDTRS